MWTDVDRCGPMWTDVDRCGLMWAEDRPMAGKRRAQSSAFLWTLHDEACIAWYLRTW